MRSLAIGICLSLFSIIGFGQNNGTQTSAPAGTPTFNKDVLPILQQKCQTCHRPGEVAPMSFLSYQSTRPWAKAMKAAVVTRKMPPGGLDPQYGHFVDNFTLS